MTTPCENKDDIKTLHTKVDNLTTSFNNFQLKTSVAIAVLETELKKDSKKSGGRAGGVWGAIVVIILAIADWAMKG